MLFWNACKKEEKAVSPPVPGNEFLTSVKLIATNTTDSTDIQTAKWAQIDQNVAPDTSLAHLTLKKDKVYNVQVLFLDETKTPASDITADIHDRANYHLICFLMASGLNLTVTRLDHDGNTPPLEVGLTDNFTTGGISSGNLEVVLHHQPNVKNGDCDRGSVDADVNFRITIQ
jgi:hypothetical protein